ncbi:hypothetical protein [Reyranella soli]|uniref:Uncharacterized protein n=1 Tax=Reyranella soli TaxID=1230389 RepID=A0A512NEG5_9HYPH|nr:hypothetical protein [Reyranella soli]GEP57340.1 hypothetical protein RSO01_45060 [Reyranella soli]
MANSFTALGFIKPEVGADSNLWGGHWNQNADLLDIMLQRFVGTTTTRLLTFNVNAISTTTTRTVTWRDVDVSFPSTTSAIVLVDTSTAQTFSNKVLGSNVTGFPGSTSGNATTFLGADIAFGVNTTFQNGPNTGSIGANGQTWFILGVAQFANVSGGSSQMEAAIFDGTNYIANGSHVLFNNEGKSMTVAIVAAVTTATTFTLRARNNNGVGGTSLQASGGATGVANKATSITAIRIA